MGAKKVLLGGEGILVRKTDRDTPDKTEIQLDARKLLAHAEHQRILLPSSTARRAAKVSRRPKPHPEEKGYRCGSS